MESEHRPLVEEPSSAGEFLAEVSRELRTPLSAIGGYAELLNLGVAGPMTEKQREMVQAIQRSHTRVIRLMDELAELSRIESGEALLRIARFRAVATLEEAAALAALRAEEQGVELAWEVECRADAAYAGDGDRVRRILANLFSIAIGRTMPGDAVRFRLSRVKGGEAPEGGPWITFVVDVPDPDLNVFLFCDPPDSSQPRLKPPAIDRRLARLMHGHLTVRHTMLHHHMWTATITLWLPEAAG